MSTMSKSNIHFFYGNDLNGISDEINEIVSEINVDADNHCLIKRKKIIIQTREDLEQFCSEFSNLQIFQSSILYEIVFSLKSIKLLEAEDNQDGFVNLIKYLSVDNKVILFLILEKYDKDIKSKISNMSILKRLGDVKIEECIKLRYWQKDKIIDKITEISKKYKLSFKDNALNLFINYLSDNLDNLNNEIIRIYLYTLPGNIVTEEVIKSLYDCDLNIEDVYEYLINHNNLKLLSLDISQLKLKSPLYIIASLQNKLREALNIKFQIESKADLQTISRLTGQNSYKLKIEISRLVNISSDVLKRKILFLSDIEYKVKSGVVRGEDSIDLLLATC